MREKIQDAFWKMFQVMGTQYLYEVVIEEGKLP